MVRPIGVSPNVRHALGRRECLGRRSDTTDAVHTPWKDVWQHDSEADDRHRRDPRRGSRAHGVRHEPAGGHRRRRRRQLLRHQQGHAGHRHGRSAVGRPVCPWSGHEQLRGPGGRPGQPEVRRPGLRSWPSRPEDDQATPQVAGQAATKLASDPNVVGVIGTLNSSTSQTVQPILADRSIVQISPANTNPTLTLGENADHVAEPAVRQLLPGGHHRPDPGPVRRPVPGARRPARRTSP